MTQGILTGVLILALAAALLPGLYYLNRLRRMQKLLRDYQETGTAGFSTMKETQESKLENTLQRLLNQAEKKEVQAKKERDEVAALLSDLTHQLKTPMANVIMYTELLEDVIIENTQAIEMANIYSGILRSMMDAFASVISNNLNDVMKILSVITIVMSIPTIIFSAYGMNLNAAGMPFSGTQWGFLIVILISIALSVIAAIVLSKKKYF